MNRIMRSHCLRAGAALAALVGVLVLAGCPPEDAFVIGDGSSTNWAAWIDYHGNVQTRGPIATEVDPESGDLDAHAGIPEFLVKNGQGQIVARVDGQSGGLYLLGQLYHVPNLETSAAPELVIQDANGVAQAIIDASGNLKYRGHIGMVMQLSAPAGSYPPGPCTTLDLEVTLYYYDEPEITALGLEIGIEDDWTYHGWVSGTQPPIYPEPGTADELDFVWIDVPSFPLTFVIRVNVPSSASGPQDFAGHAFYRLDGPELASNLCIITVDEGSSAEGEGQGPCEGEGQGEGEGEGQGKGEGEGEGEGESEGQAEPHSADINGDWDVSLSELLRLIQFYNSGGYHCQAGTEDGYAPGSGDTSCDAHDSDYNPQNWVIGLTELLRLVQFFNTPCGYVVDPESEDGYAPACPEPEMGTGYNELSGFGFIEAGDGADRTFPEVDVEERYQGCATVTRQDEQLSSFGDVWEVTFSTTCVQPARVVVQTQPITLSSSLVVQMPAGT